MTTDNEIFLSSVPAATDIGNSESFDINDLTAIAKAILEEHRWNHDAALNALQARLATNGALRKISPPDDFKKDEETTDTEVTA